MKPTTYTTYSKLLFLLLLSVGFLACSKDSDSESGSGTVFILNEGLFNSGTAEITRYNPETGEVLQSAFSAANNGAVLGDILQSAKLIDNELYLVVNNSRRIVVTDPKTLVQKRVITLPSTASPRYVEKGLNDDILVTDLFSTYLKFVNKTTGTVRDSINIRSNSESLVRVQNLVFVANPGPWPTYTDSITVINLTNSSFQKVKLNGVNFNEIKADNQNRVWISATGNYDDIPGKLIVLDSQTNAVIRTIDVGGTPGDLAINPNRNEVLVLNFGKVQIIDSQNFTIKQQKTVSGTPYALALDEIAQQVYVTDAKNYTTDGLVTVFSAQLDSITQVTTGVNPGFVHITY